MLHLAFGQTKQFLDECQTGEHKCSSNAICGDTVGSYECECKIGFVGDGLTCVSEPLSVTPFDEDTFTCLPLGKSNIFACQCQDGFRDYKFAEMSGTYSYKCADIDECEDGSHRCHPHASCANTVGGYSCHCLTGYTGNGYTRCQPVPTYAKRSVSIMHK